MKASKVILLFVLCLLMTMTYRQIHAQKLSRPATLQSSGNESWDDRFDQLGISGTVLAAAANGSVVYVAGSFTAAGAVSVNNIAKWDGASWSALGTGGSNGTNGLVNAIAIDGNNVYAGGSFSAAGGVSVNNIAKWDGTNWSALGTGANGDVRAIAVDGSDVYVGGFFSLAGGVSTSNIARWDGSNWNALGTGANSTVRALVVNNNLIYAGGDFTAAGATSANKIAAWNSDSTTWSVLGTGVNGDVNALQIKDSDVFVGGVFTAAGGASAKKVAKWNGSTWSPLGGGVSGGVIHAMGFIGNILFVAGSFTTADTTSASEVAKWDGAKWDSLGSGITGGHVFALATTFTDVCLGGAFTTAGDSVSQKFAIWNEIEGGVPVELFSFAGKQVERSVVLEWATASESNNFGFEIERTTANNMQNADWNKIGFVQGNSTTNEPRNYSYTDDVSGLLESGVTTARYRLRQRDTDGAVTVHNEIEVSLGQLPSSFQLAQNYPNPFNPQTTITFTVPQGGLVTLEIYNMLGQKVATLLHERVAANVAQRVEFNAQSLASGTYYYTLKSGNLSLSKRMTLIR